MCSEKGSDGLNDIQRLTLAIHEEAERMKIHNHLLEKKVDSDWEYVIAARKEFEDGTASLKKPFWKRWVGID